jgi:hypothetical protein
LISITLVPLSRPSQEEIREICSMQIMYCFEEAGLRFHSIQGLDKVIVQA